MQLGRFPGQCEALQEELERRRRAARRRFLLAGLGGLMVGCGLGWVAGARSGGSQAHPAVVDLARALARGPRHRLVEAYTFLLDALELEGGDPDLWLGARRLADYALTGDGPQARRIARGLAAALSAVAPPADLAALRSRLEMRGEGR